jgi:ribosomal protein S1
VGSIYRGKILGVREDYVVVELSPGIPAIAAKSNFPPELASKLKEKYKVGNETIWIIKSIDKDNRQIQLAPIVS